MKAKIFQKVFRQTCNPATSRVESAKIILLGSMGAEILAIFRRFSVDLTKSAKKEIFEKLFARSDLRLSCEEQKAENEC